MALQPSKFNVSTDSSCADSYKSFSVIVSKAIPFSSLAAFLASLSFLEWRARLMSRMRTERMRKARMSMELEVRSNRLPVDAKLDSYKRGNI